MMPSADNDNASIANHPAPPSIISTTSFEETVKPTGHNSKLSVSSTKSHKEYIDSLVCPSQDVIQQISRVQSQKETQNIKKLLSQDANGKELSDIEREHAAALIQRNYRGHRERRILNGLSLDAGSRWVEAIKEARFRHATEPRPRESLEDGRPSVDGPGSDLSRPSTSHARENWRKVGVIARRAGGDEDSDSDDSLTDHESISSQERERIRKKRLEAKLERQKAAKIMDLQYFLEMVDVKHRYGSNLRVYHEEWKKADTHENFFYWLDYGEGRYIDCQGCSRERLDKEQVRYLSKEERRDYLVKIDHEGRLCWVKNGAYIDTTEKYKDSIHGIVPDTDPTPAYKPVEVEAAIGLQDHAHFHSHSSSDSESDEEEHEAANKYATNDFDKAKGVKKIKHVSASTIFNKLLRGSIKKNTWIFVADTNFRLYVGIKQSGTFQHSSFLHGSRISAAGLIKIKNGRLSKLSPLSGHYRPPVSNFRAFIHSLKDEGVDMSHVSISRSYAVLVGLEAYTKTRKRGKKIVQKLIHGRDKLLSATELALKEEEKRDKKEDDEKEKRILELRQKADDDESPADLRLLEKLGMRPREPEHASQRSIETKRLEVTVTGPENETVPEGTRVD